MRAALPHLRAVNGRAVFISATSVGRPLPGMGAYATSKAALEELARAWRSEHPEVSFSTVAIGMTLGTGVTDNWDGDLLGELSTVWSARGSCVRQRPRATCSATEVADTVVSVLAAPTCLPFVSVLARPRTQRPACVRGRLVRRSLLREDATKLHHGVRGRRGHLRYSGRTPT